MKLDSKDLIMVCKPDFSIQFFQLYSILNIHSFGYIHNLILSMSLIVDIESQSEDVYIRKKKTTTL